MTIGDSSSRLLAKNGEKREGKRRGEERNIAIFLIFLILFLFSNSVLTAFEAFANR